MRPSDRIVRCGCPEGLPCTSVRLESASVDPSFCICSRCFPATGFRLSRTNEKPIALDALGQAARSRSCSRGFRRDDCYASTGGQRKTVDLGERIGFQHKHRHHAVRAGRWSPWDCGFAVMMCGAKSPLKKRGNRVFRADPAVAGDGQ